MAPEVIARKLLLLNRYINDLEPLSVMSREEILSENYKVERLLELLILTAIDLVSHLVAQRGRVPETYRDAFKIAGEIGLIDKELAARLQLAAGMRNILVHQYGEINQDILVAATKTACKDFSQLRAALTPFSQS